MTKIRCCGLARPVVGALLLTLVGCSGMLPRSRSTAESPWENFSEARAAFDQIVPYQTQSSELAKLGFDPFGGSSNVNSLDYAEITRRFYPSSAVPPESIAKGVAECVSKQDACRGYEITIKKVKRRRTGNFLLDFMNFHRKTEITGWEFDAVLLIKDDLVVHKVWSGKPAIHEIEENRNPLGPLQGAGERSLR